MLLPLAAGAPADPGPSIATPLLWTVTIGAVVLLLLVDFLLTRRPHAVKMKEAVGWSVFYVALPLGFGAWLWQQYGASTGVDYLTGYLVEKSLSVDNLFVFMLLLTAFAVPEELRQRVLLYGIIGALVMRAVFIALGAAALSYFDAAFLVFGLILLLTGLKLLLDELKDEEKEIDVSQIRSVRLARRFMPVTEDYEGPRMTATLAGKRALTPFALVVVAVLGADLVFAVDSVPAVYGITEDPFLVFATNAFALLGLRALYFVLEGALGKLTHLGFGLSLILFFIGTKLVIHWGHLVWGDAFPLPEIGNVTSLLVILAILVVVTVTSLLANRRNGGQDDAELDGGRHDGLDDEAVGAAERG